MKKTLLAVMAMVSLCGYAQVAVEGFESPWVGNPAAPPGWTVVNEQGPLITWQQSQPGTNTQPYEGEHAAYLNKENIAPTAAMPKDWLISPAITVQPNAMLQFYSMLSLAGDQGGIYKVYVGYDPADLTTFTEIYSATELEINPVQTEYTLKQIALPATYEGEQLHIAFVMIGDDADRWAIDNVGVFTVCDGPSELSITNVTNTSADLSWTQIGDVTTWEIEVIPANSVPTGIGMVYNGTAPFTITGLVSGTYKVYMRSICADGSAGIWVGPLIFSTDQTFNNKVHGLVKYDANGDDVCGEGDIAVPNTQVVVTVNGEYLYDVYTNAEGEYEIYGFEDGEYTIGLQIAPTPAYPNVPVMEVNVVFDEEVNDWDIAHCLQAPIPFNDMGVTVYATGNPVPGFDVIYVLYVTNSGTESNSNVSATFDFDDNRFTYVSSTLGGTVFGNTVTIPFGDVDPAEWATAIIVLHVIEPPVNIGGEEVDFTVALSEIADDADLSDNTEIYHDIITNSFDPNDITVHEGAKISETQAGDYLTYTIRFQNMGNGNAINIRVENTLDELLDWDTFEPIISSHNYNVTRTEGQLVFNYPNIQLPFEDADEPGSHGFVTYRIKPKAEFGLGDIISNQAEIYFDFNEAVITNVATTEVVALAGLNNNALAIATLYPNPVKDQLYVEVAQGELQSITIHDINGRLCLSANAQIIDTNALSSGIYLVKVTTNAGSANYKLIKQ